MNEDITQMSRIRDSDELDETLSLIKYFNGLKKEVSFIIDTIGRYIRGFSVGITGKVVPGTNRVSLRKAALECLTRGFTTGLSYS